MPDRAPVTRDSLRTELLVNAATKPLALAVGAGVAAAAFLLGVGWLLVAAAVLYVAIAGATFFDEEEAARVGKNAYMRARLARADRALPKGLSPELASLLERAREEERRVVRAIADLDLPFSEISVEIDRLTAEMERIAPRAQVILDYLDDQRPDDVRRRLETLRRETNGEHGPRERVTAALEDQLRIHAALESELERFGSEMEHLIASLAVVRGELVRVRIADDSGQEDVARQIRELRERVSTLADEMHDAVGTLRRRDSTPQG